MSTRPILLDFSNRPELHYLAALAGAFRAATGDSPFFLVGATARDLLLQYAHGINSGRKTRDVDLALMLPDWATFEAIRSRLLAGGRFSANGTALHKLVFEGFLEVDLIPFGAIERADRSIAWPPDGEFVMTVFGFHEVFETTLPVQLPDGEKIRIVSLPALAVLKLLAWTERRLTEPGKDAYDLAAILRKYLDAGNHERLYTDAAQLLDEPDFDYELAGAWLLGHDMAQILPRAARPRVAEILNREGDPHGAVLLAGDMPIDATRVLALLQSAAKGFREVTD